MKTVKNYSGADHRAALYEAAKLIKDKGVPYNTKRARLQSVVMPLFVAEYTQAEAEALADRSSYVREGLVTFKPNPSNFVQRMNLKTLGWIIANHRVGSSWPDVWEESVINKFGNSFANPDIDGAEAEDNYNEIVNTLRLVTGESKKDKTMTNTAAASVVPAIVNVGELVDVLDAIVASGKTQAEAIEALSKMYPSDGAALAGADNLRTMRGERKEELKLTAEAEAIVKAVAGGVVAPAKGTDMAALDPSTAKVIDGVLNTLGLPGINEIIGKANESSKVTAAMAEAAAMAKEVAALKAKLAAKPMAGPVTVAAAGELPGGRVETRNAADLFGLTGPKKSLLDFDVPVGVWTNAAGDEKDADGKPIVHPYVPETNEHFIFNLSTLVPILLSIVTGNKPWLRGHTGTGKTTVVEQVYARLNLPLYRVNLDSDISRSELVGRDTIKSDPKTGQPTSQFVEGIIPRAMQEPCGLLLDEVDASRPDLTFVLQRLTEGKGFMLLEDGGRTINAHPWFRLFATANTNGRGDETGLYTGTRVLGSAFVNRFGPFLMVDYIDQKSEFKLVQMHSPALDKGLAEQIVGYAKEHRVAFTQGQVTLPCSPRDTLQLSATMVNYLGLFPTQEEAIKLAFEHTIFNAADADDVVILKGLADRFIAKAKTMAKASAAAKS